ncbi:MAG: Tol-Pal system beta propeller repeat protein TolB [Candidatus Thiodiazotropha sp. (ex Semelilucina semeliformis)]|nr:Tol-Pal system beta propeller repeat protein TolB [Candidatus Thiodiazotropha sp. (ex Semelilucina semeliformis)]MCU7830424.1 Tol-Pal system beta propeller repeat protein TolB [Candidatus Thiodiazotropha sp. (ex Myrtea sp. 'scaly one' KF741663)]
MKKFFWVLFLSAVWLQSVQADLTIEITEGVEGALPIAVVPFSWQGPGQPPVDVSDVINADLQRSGRFKTIPQVDMLARPTAAEEIEFKDWRALDVENLVVGQVRPQGTGGYEIRFLLFDVYKGEQLTGYTIPTTAPNLRATAHRIADLIYEKLLGIPGAFATRVAYITSVRQGDGQERIDLNIADADGYNPETIVSSTEPLMSPAWSPDGRKLAYVSFEEGRSAIYVQEVYTGKRQKVTAYKGINGAPAWSPDGRKLAMALSKDGNPDIFVYDLATRKLKSVARHYAIDTEPAWSPDGRSLVFTSDRGGKPQIYRVPSYGGQAKRITFQNSYNARASFSPDGKLLALVTLEDGSYRIAVQDLDSGIMQVLSQGSLDESPSFAPNGSMIIYASKAGYRGVLAAVSVDGRVRQRLALQEGDVREPVWSPFKK